VLGGVEVIPKVSDSRRLSNGGQVP
jgi:hypothetical protein